MPDDVLGRIVATHLSERRHSSSEAQVEAAENGLTHPEHVILTPTRNPSVGERARELLVRANEVMESAPLPLPRSPLTRTRAARRPNEGMACPATGAETAPSLRRVCSGKGSVVHGLLLEYSDGVRTGLFVENDGSPLWLFDNAALMRRGGVWQVAGLCGVGR